MPKRVHSTMILMVVFVLGLGAGIAGMVWAWPGVRTKYFQPPRRERFVPMLTRTLRLTPQQVPQVQSVVDEQRKQVHDIHVQFIPRYNKVCEDFLQIVHDEREVMSPVRQQELDKLKAIMTSSQWDKFESDRAQAAKAHPQRPPDACRNGSPSPGGSGGPGQPPRRR